MQLLPGQNFIPERELFHQKGHVTKGQLSLQHASVLRLNSKLHSIAILTVTLYYLLSLMCQPEVHWLSKQTILFFRG